jgi:putative colanic acid biosynthesis UDP-glucose lipid carrier transferase
LQFSALTSNQMPETTPNDPVRAFLSSEAPPSLGRDSLLSFLEAILEPVVVVLGLWWTAFHLRGDLSLLDLMLSIVIFALCFPGKPRLGKRYGGMIFEVLLEWYWVVFLLAVGSYASGYLSSFPTDVALAWLVFIPAGLVAAHAALSFSAPLLVQLQGPPHRAVVVGMNDQGVFLAGRIIQSPYSRIELAGFFDDRDLDRLSAFGDYRLIGPLSELANYVRDQQIKLIYLSIPMASQPRILNVLDHLKDTTASIFFVPDMFVTDLIQGRSGVVCGVPVISVCETPFTGLNGVSKRILDIFLSIIILFLISPILIGFAIAVKLTSPGPVVFKQRRHGLDGQQIIVYKFRSMTVTEDGANVQQAQKNDKRITPLGAFMRRTSIDELPQFINVLQGRMSIVGPRPHAVAHNEQYRKLIKGYMVRHKVRPGITGWAQVNGFRGETETIDKMEGRIKLDLDYLRNWSVSLDMYIIYRTVRLVFSDKKAY